MEHKPPLKLKLTFAARYNGRYDPFLDPDIKFEKIETFNCRNVREAVIKADRKIMITIKISFFASIRAIIGVKSIQLEIPEGSTISDLKEILVRKYPEAADAFPGLLTSINRVFSQEHDLIPEDAEVAFFSHIAGGS